MEHSIVNDILENALILIVLAPVAVIWFRLITQLWDL